MKCGNRVSRNILGCFCWWHSMEFKAAFFCNLFIFVAYLRNFTSVFPSTLLKVFLWCCWLQVTASAAKCPVISRYWRSCLSSLHHAREERLSMLRLHVNSRSKLCQEPFSALKSKHCIKKLLLHLSCQVPAHKHLSITAQWLRCSMDPLKAKDVQ